MSRREVVRIQAANFLAPNVSTTNTEKIALATEIKTQLKVIRQMVTDAAGNVEVPRATVYDPLVAQCMVKRNKDRAWMAMPFIPSAEGRQCAAVVQSALEWLGIRQFEAGTPRPVMGDRRAALQQAEHARRK